MKHRFVQKTGKCVETSRFMEGPALHIGYEWVHTGVTDDGLSVWIECVQMPPARDTLFGYKPDDLLRKQYK